MALNEKESEAKKKPHEMTNAEYVSKLMAATPSYFFTPTSLPQAGHNFFFSELLRSLVQKRKAEELNLAAMKAKSLTKKIRKPTTYQQYHQQKSPPEQEYKKPKLSEDAVKVTAAEMNDNDQENSQDSVINVDKDDPPATTSTQQQPSVPALPQSAFTYPYVDPLHFFIDLRVSAGQIYDRKKEAYLQQALSSWNNNNNPIIGKNRNSAFKVPISSQSEQSQGFNAINLISSHQQSEQPRTAFQKIFKSARSDDDEDDAPAESGGGGSRRGGGDDIQIFDLDKSDRMN